MCSSRMGRLSKRSPHSGQVLMSVADMPCLRSGPLPGRPMPPMEAGRAGARMRYLWRPGGDPLSSRGDVVVQPEDVVRVVAALERGEALTGPRAVHGRPGRGGARVL